MPEPAKPVGGDLGSHLTPDVVRDWATIWQSELAALAADPESWIAAESLLQAWLQTWVRAGHGVDAGGDAARPDAPARAAPAGAAAGVGDSEIERLRARIAALEQRLGG